MTDEVGRWREDMAALNAVNLQALRTIAQDDIESARVISGLSMKDCELIAELTLADIYKIARTPILLFRPNFENELLRRSLREHKAQDDPIGVSGVAAAIRQTGLKID